MGIIMVTGELHICIPCGILNSIYVESIPYSRDSHDLSSRSHCDINMDSRPQLETTADDQQPASGGCVPAERGIPARRIENSCCTAEAVALSFVQGTAPLIQLLLRNENEERSLG